MDDVLQTPPPKLTRTQRTTFKRRAQRGSHERAAIDAILDEALVAHVGVTVDGQPRVLPTAHVRLGDRVYLHGSRANRMLCAAIAAPCCITVTLLDGLVLSRTAFHHSMNYRSVVLYGQARDVTDESEKRAALHALVEHIAPGRSLETRAPTEAELKTTLVIALEIEEGSAKARTGPPIDDAEVMNDLCWAGVLPLKLCALPPQPDPQLAPTQLLSPSVQARARQLAPP